MATAVFLAGSILQAWPVSRRSTKAGPRATSPASMRIFLPEYQTREATPGPAAAPGMVATEEFNLRRFRGDQDKRDAVYAGVRNPLVAEDIARAVAWVATLPSHMNIDLMVLRPRAQATQTKVHRE